MSGPDMCNHPAWKSVDEDTRECVYCGIRRRYPAAVTLKEETFDPAPAVPVGVPVEGPKGQRLEERGMGRAFISAHSGPVGVQPGATDELMSAAQERIDERHGWVGVQPEPAEEVETVDGMANDCRHDSATGVDTAAFGPDKVWRCDHCGLRWRQGDHATPAVPVVHPEPGDRAESQCARCREPIWQGTDEEGALTPWWHIGGPRPHDHDVSPLAPDATLGERVRAAFGPGSVAIHAFVDSEVAAAVAAVRADTWQKGHDAGYMDRVREDAARANCAGSGSELGLDNIYPAEDPS